MYKILDPILGPLFDWLYSNPWSAGITLFFVMVAALIWLLSMFK